MLAHLLEPHATPGDMLHSMTPESHSSWRIGELAEATGLTVRALLHYEAMNLVIPTARTPGGHRLYGPRAVEQLYQVLALRPLGLPLEDIRHLTGAGAPPAPPEPPTAP